MAAFFGMPATLYACKSDLLAGRSGLVVARTTVFNCCLVSVSGAVATQTAFKLLRKFAIT